MDNWKRYEYSEYFFILISNRDSIPPNKFAVLLDII